MRQTVESDYPRTSYAWYTVILLLIIYTISFIDRQILNLLAPALRQEFELSYTEFGFLSGGAFAIFYVIFGLFFARIADSRSRRGLIAFGLIFWSLMTALSGLVRSFTQLFLCRVGVGVGEATLAPAANSIIADSFPKHRLGTAISVYTMGIPIGVGLAYVIGAQVISLAGSLPDVTVAAVDVTKTWQKAFMLVGVPGLLVTIFILTLREPSRKGISAGKNAIPVKEVLDYIKAHRKAYISICVGMGCVAALGFGSAAFLPAFFNDVHGVSPARMGQIFGWIAVVTGPVGLLAGGYLADRWMNAGLKDAYPKTLMIAPIGFFIPATIFPFLDYSWVLWVTVGTSNLFLNLPAGAAFASLQVITPNQMRGQIVAIYVLITNIGYTIGPLAIGFFSDTLFEGPFSIGYGMALLAILAMPASLGLFQWGRKHYAAALIGEEKRLADLKT